MKLISFDLNVYGLLHVGTTDSLVYGICSSLQDSYFNMYVKINIT